MSRKVFSPEHVEREAQLVKDRKAGASIGQLSREYGMPHMSIRGILAREGMTGGPPAGKVFKPTT